MLVVRVEMWPLGDKSRAYLLQEMTISNVGGDMERGEYNAVLSHSTTFKGKGLEDLHNPPAGTVWKRATVRGFNRSLSPMTLVARALKACGVS